MKALVVMTRIPVPGRTKTRLLTILSPGECAGIHRSFLTDILEMTTHLGRGIDTFVYYGDEGPLDMIEDIIPENIVRAPQRGRDLGEKMKNIFEEMFERGYKEVILMGSDIPEVDPEELEKAFGELKGRDIIFGPTLDGGYYLVGMKKLYESIFSQDIKWGTPEVFRETMDLLKKRGIEVGLIKVHEDIDTREDLEGLWNRIRSSGSCKNTRRYIDGEIGERLLCHRG